MRYLPPPQLADYLLGNLYFSGLAHEEGLGPRIERAAHWYAELFGGGLEGIPFPVVYDVGHLLLEGAAAPLAMGRWFERFPASERSLRSRYGNGYLAHLLERPWFLRAHDIVATSEGADRAVVHALDCLLRPLDGAAPGDLVFQPARFVQLPWGRLGRECEQVGTLAGFAAHREAFQAWNEGGGDLAEGLRAFLDRSTLVSGKTLLGELELFELTHIHALPSRERRLAARQLKQAELLLGNLDQARLGRPREVEQVDTSLTDEGTFPAGGLGALATRGSWENLVRSELLFLGDRDHGEEPDLFAVRFSEGQLLFYTRDGATLRRQRRRFHLYLELDRDLRVKFPEHPMALDRLLLGWMARLAADVLTVFEKDACEVVLGLIGEGAEEAAELLELRFQEEATRGEVAVGLPREIDPETWRDPRRKTVALWASRGGRLDRHVRHSLRVSGVQFLPVQLGEGGEEAGFAEEDPVLPLDEELLLRLEEVRDVLLERIVSG